MPVVFLVPAILAGLAAVVVPVILHLRRRERERPMRFPSLMFLQRVTITTARRRRITDWPLLLVRAAIVTLAVLAFARPVVRPRPDAAPARGTRRVVVALDRSMSMSRLGLWGVALDSARAIVNGLVAGDRVAVVSFDEEARIDQPLTLDHAAALAALGRVRPGSRGTHFSAGIRAARDLLATEVNAGGGEIVLVSDLQRNGAVGMTGLTLPPAIRLRAVGIGPGRHANASITGVDVQRLPGAGDSPNRLAVSVRLAARGLAQSRKIHVSLTANGRAGGGRDVLLPPDGSATAVLDPVALPMGLIRLTVTMDQDSLAADDTFNAVVPAELVRRVILVVPPDLGPDETLYLERALEAGRDPALRVERRNPASLDATTLRDALAVVLFDVALPSGNRGTVLASWVHDGGGLVSVVARRTANRPASPGLLPGTSRGMVDRTADRGGVLGAASPEHPVFAPLRGGTGAPLGSARFFRYARLVPGADAEVVARFDDGLPALLERTEGAGRVLQTAMPLDETSGDFPLQPAYLPFVRGLVLYAAGSAAAPMWRAAGDGWLVPPVLRNPVVRTPAGELLRPDPGRATNAVMLDEAGFYAVYDGQPSGDPAATIAVNPPSAESDLATMTPGEILVGVAPDSVKAPAMTAASLADAERRQRIWRDLLLLAALALAAETLMSSRGWRGTATRLAGTAMGEGAS